MRLAKRTDYVRGRHVLGSYTQAKLKARYDYNPRTEAWGGEATAAVSHAMFRVSEDQDVRISAGCRVPLSPTGAGAAEPFLRVEENCWSATTDLKGGWRVAYAL